MPSSSVLHPLVHRSAVLAAIATLALVGCRAATGPDTHAAELLGARVPAAVPAGASFEVVGYFGRGACDVVTRVVQPIAGGVRLSLRRSADTPQQPCIGLMVRDSVVAQIGSSAPRPFTVRLGDLGAPDSVVVVRAAP